MTERWPKILVPAAGPMRPDRLDGAAAGMGEWGTETRALAAEGWVPPDMMTGLTLFLLSNQPRDPRKQSIPGGGGGVAGGVWVRERFTLHRPLARADAFSVTGTAVGRHVHKGRRYGTNQSQTHNAQGQLVAQNVTTGLLAYQVDASLTDRLEGQAPEQVAAPQPDWAAAVENPCLAALKALTPGAVFETAPVTVSLDLMAARDTQQPDNPIHSDPELAKKAGLSKPIAGGSHVLAFVLEVLMRQVGRHALLHGACFDVRWKAPVYADQAMVPWVEVVAVGDDRVSLRLEARLVSGAVAMSAEVTVPLI